MQSLFIGLGATLANALPYIFNHFGVTHEGANGVPLSVVYAFRIGALAFILSVLWTVFTTKEDPPADMAAFELHKRETRGFGAGFQEMVALHPRDAADDEAAFLGAVLYLVRLKLRLELVYAGCGEKRVRYHRYGQSAVRPRD